MVLLSPVLAHAFGQRYELPIPLYLFVFGGAGIVFLSFLLVIRRDAGTKSLKSSDQISVSRPAWPPAVAGFVLLALLAAAGLAGSQEIPENILPTAFWVVVWVAVPLSCGLLGDWTRPLNPFANIAQLAGVPAVRQALLGRRQPFSWPSRAGWWPAAVLYFALACFELIFNRVATLPRAIAAGLLVYFAASALAGLVYGAAWLRRGEVFTILFSTWGRLGYYRFGSAGRRGFAGGLRAPFEPSASRIAFVLLLLVSVSFDGLISTPLWNRFRLSLPDAFQSGSWEFELLSVTVFILLGWLIWLVFSLFSRMVAKAGVHRSGPAAVLAGLLPSLLPISFGYLLAHYFEYLVINLQLLLPLIGNPVGKDSWPLHLPYPFNDDYEVHTHPLPSSFYWYLAVTIIVAAHIVAVIIAHRHLLGAATNSRVARRSEYPWIAAMVIYTMLSLWLLAQPLVKDKPKESGRPTAADVINYVG